jgi:hypothetical protein
MVLQINIVELVIIVEVIGPSSLPFLFANNYIKRIVAQQLGTPKPNLAKWLPTPHSRTCFRSATTQHS